MKEFENFVSEITEGILSEKNKLDERVFLGFLKEELERKGIDLTVIRQFDAPFIDGSIICSDVMGVELDLSEHDKEKDIEIKKQTELNALLSKQLEDERQINIHLLEKLESFENKWKKELEDENKKYKSVLESAKCERDKQVCEYRNEIDALKRRIKELQEELEENRNLPYEPIDVAKFLIYRENYVHGVSELRQIAEHLLVYCNHAEVE